jgi:uncharacterized membrane protein
VTQTEGDAAETVETIAALHAHAQQSIGRHQRVIEQMTAEVGRPRTLYVVVTVLVLWIAFNFMLSQPIDKPPFQWLQGAVTMYAALVTTIVLIAQTRQAKHTEQRGYLDLQVNLLAEQKLAKVIALLEELRRDLPSVRNRQDPQADEMAHELDPHAVMSALEDVLDDKTQSAASQASDKG